MLCAKCKTENPDGLKFCNECGAPFKMPCASCGFENASTAKFCGQCGAAFGASAAAASAKKSEQTQICLTDVPAAENLDGERKTVTVLFADIKGSMELIEDLDPEEARAIVDPALKLMIEAVQRYGGYVAQSTGDGIFALFGAPIAYEDHPQRALYAALGMQEELKRHSDRICSEGGLQVQVRVGVNSGEVVVRTIQTGDAHTEYVPVGHATSLAARMQALAPIGSIAATEGVRKLCEGYFTFKSLGPTKVKGVSAPVEVYEVTGPGPLRSHFELSARRGLTRFVGRGRELEQMTHAFEDAQNGHGQIVAVVADAGTGKSRLFHEFKAAIVPTCKVLQAYSVSHGTTSPWLPVLELLRSYFGIENADDATLRREKVRKVLSALDQALEETLPYLFSLLGIIDPDPLTQMEVRVKRQRTLDALKRVLLAEALRHPLVLIVEDLHWIDEQTQALLDLLVESVPAARGLILFNYRPEYRHNWTNKSYYTQIRLNPLSEADGTTMLAALLGEGAELAPLKRMIAERTGGNPFFIEEIVRALFEDGSLVRNGAVRLMRSLSQLRLPPTVQGILTGRIDRLSAGQKDLLQMLAVIGRQSSLHVLRRLVPSDDAKLERTLAELRAGEFIYDQPSAEDVVYVFKHALTQEVAYSSLLVERRKVLHERVGNAIEEFFSNRLDEHSGELAYHYSRSYNAEKALSYLRSAGELAVRRSANLEGVALFNSALEMVVQLPETPARDKQELDLLLELGPALMSIKGFAAAECEAVYRRANDVCRRIGETPRLYAVLWGQWMSRSVQARWNEAMDLATKLESIANATNDPEFILEAHHVFWNTCFFRGELAKSQFHVKEGLTLYDPERHQLLFSRFGAHDPGVCANCHGALNLWLLGKPDRSVGMIDAALHLAQRLNHHHDIVRARVDASWLWQLRREPTVATQHAKVAAKLSSEYALPLWQARANIVIGWSLGEQGQPSEGIPLMRQALAQYKGTGAEQQYSYFLLLLAETLLKQGKVDESMEVLADAETMLKNNGERFYEPELYRAQAEALQRKGPSGNEFAEQKLRVAVSTSRQLGFKSWELRATTSLARLLRDTNRRDEARAMLAEIYNWFTEGFDTADLKDARALLDELNQ